MSTASVLINHPGELGGRGMTLAAAEFPLKSFPLGFRFHPTDEELINHYLKGKIDGSIRSEVEVIIEVDVCKCEPWDLPGKSLIQSDDQEWFFFSPKDRKYPNGHRSNRATKAGYWKATGKDRIIRTRARPHARPTVIGTKKTLVFHRGRAPRGVRTNWIMHEYRTTEPEYESGEQGSYVLYRLFKKLESPSSNFDAMEKSGFSPTPERSSPGDAQIEPDILEEFATPSGFSPVPSRSSPCDAQNEPDNSEEFTTPLHQQSTGLDLQEDPQSLSGTVKKRPAGIGRWLADKSDCSTTYSVKPEESHCNGNMTSDASDHEAKVAAKVDALIGVLAESYDPQYDQIDSDGFPTISSPMLPYMDHPLFGNIDQGSHMGLYLDDKNENDSLNELLSMIISNQDEYSLGGSYAQKDSVVEMVPEGNVSMPHNSFWDSAPGKDSACACASDVYTEAGVLQGGSSMQASDWLSFDRCPEIKPNFGNQYENANLLPYDSAGPDVYSVDPTSESLQELFDSMEGSAGQNNTVNAEPGLKGTGINIRSRKPLNPQTSNILASQGKATRRIRLQVGPISCESSGSTNGKDDHEGKAITSECLQEREHVEHKSVGGEILGLAQLDRLKNLSINDFMASPKTKPDSSEMFQETKPSLRPRAKWNSDAGLEPKAPPLLQRTPRAVSAAVSITRLVILVMILVLLSVGIRCMSSQCVDSRWFFII